MQLSFNGKTVAALSLCLLSPIIAEYLLGDWTLRQLSSLSFLIPLYGVGALLIREFSRYHQLGWAGIVSLSIAFGLIEEGLLTQSFFNADYYHAGLISYAYVDALGTSFFWVVFVLGLHSLGSICLPILMTEIFTCEALRKKVWFGKGLFFLFLTIYILGALSIYIGTQAAFSYQSSVMQKTSVLIAAGLFVVLPFFYKRRKATAGYSTPSPVCVFFIIFSICSYFFAQHYLKVEFIFGEYFVIFSMLLSYILGFYLIFRWCSNYRWREAHQLSICLSLLIIYSILGLYQFSKGKTGLGFSVSSLDMVLQFALILAILWPVIIKLIHYSKNNTC